MIKAIYIADEHGGETRRAAKVELVAGKGIVGDRNYDHSKWPGQNITFIEAEEVARYNDSFGQAIEPADVRRNVITEGVRLNDLVGKEFSIGDARFVGVELCEPCADLGAVLANDSISKEGVVKAFVHKGGLRADVLEGGSIGDGMPIVVDGEAD